MAEEAGTLDHTKFALSHSNIWLERVPSLIDWPPNKYNRWYNPEKPAPLRLDGILPDERWKISVHFRSNGSHLWKWFPKVPSLLLLENKYTRSSNVASIHNVPIGKSSLFTKVFAGSHFRCLVAETKLPSSNASVTIAARKVVTLGQITISNILVFCVGPNWYCIEIAVVSIEAG